MIDTNELRRKVNSTDAVDHIDLHANIKPFLSELIDRLEAAEKERDDVAQQLVQSEIGKRKISEERDTAELMSLALRAKIAEMEKQEPVAEWVDSTFDQYPYLRWREPYKAIAGAKLYTKFYALPGAKGEGK